LSEISGIRLKEDGTRRDDTHNVLLLRFQCNDETLFPETLAAEIINSTNVFCDFKKQFEILPDKCGCDNETKQCFVPRSIQLAKQERWLISATFKGFNEFKQEIMIFPNVSDKTEAISGKLLI
jgi:hypothetical protein